VTTVHPGNGPGGTVVVVVEVEVGDVVEVDVLEEDVLAVDVVVGEVPELAGTS
jgi:hypothetical protein